MFLRTILFIGIHLLYFTNVANPMVLLTANVEDIKKIARKFLSENVADTIAEFILKATGGLRKNKDLISEENDQNQKDINNLSVEGKIGRAGRQRPSTPANHFVDYESTIRHIKKILPGSLVYNTPAFELNAERAERLDGNFDDDFRTDTTIRTSANDDTQMKQARDLRQEINEYNDEKYYETTTVGGNLYDAEIKKPPKYNAYEEEESQSKYSRTQYSESGKHRLIATVGEDPYDVDIKKHRQPKYSAEEEESRPKSTSSQYSKSGKHRLIASVGEDPYDVDIQKPRQPKYSAEEEESRPKFTNSQYSKSGKHRLIDTVGGDHYDVEINKPRQPKYSAEDEEESLPKYTSSQYSKKVKHRLIATSGSIILPRLED